MLLRVAVATPFVHLGEPKKNAGETASLAMDACEQGAQLVVFPELGLTGYSIDDLHHQQQMLEAAERGFDELCQNTAGVAAVILVGLPLRVDSRLFNCAVAIHRGRPLAVVPKTYLPNYREFYEKRYFAAGSEPAPAAIELGGSEVPFGTDLLLQAQDLPDFVLHIEVCEDLWTPVPPSSLGALAGATVLANLSASNATLGKSEDRKSLARAQSLRCIAAHVFSAAGPGESTTDLAWDGQGLVHELGQLIAEGERFQKRSQVLLADVDLERIVQERMRITSFGDARSRHRNSFRRVRFQLGPALQKTLPLLRPNPRYPFVPSDPALRDERCFEAYSIQCQGLTQRLRSAGVKRVVLGVSGGLDSTHALLVAVAAMKDLGEPATNVLAYSLPGFATSQRTHDNARELARALGVSWGEIDIRPQSAQMLRDISHPAADTEGPYDTTYENVQAGARTSILFRLANRHDAMVLGTGDLSELALGWCTYGVGDQMSHYNVNASVPKTLLQSLLKWVGENDLHGSNVSARIEDVLRTPISPELIPSSREGEMQDTEAVIGPFELHDFFLYHTLRYGLTRDKIRALALDAWGPETAAREDHHYTEDVIERWLGVFLSRFFGSTQFKRSAAPNGPKVTSGGSLSPRGDWRAPSDVSANIWR